MLLLIIATILGGNHEIAAAEAWVPFQTRYPSPNKGSGSSNFCYYGKEIGPVHVIALCSYAGFFHNSAQYQWLQTYLATSLNRVRTPWLVVMTHASLYNSNKDHWMEAELFRLSMEPLLYEYGVDAYITGHTHTYERSLPVYDNKVNPCGAVHLVVGSGGNSVSADSRALSAPWRFPQPDWSAFRVASFGPAQLEVLSPKSMKVTWQRVACSAKAGPPAYGMNFSTSCVSPFDNSDQKALTYDSYVFTKPTKLQCPNRWKTSDAAYARTYGAAVSSTGTAAIAQDFSQPFNLKDGFLVGLILFFAMLFLRERLLRNKNRNAPVKVTDLYASEKV